MPEKTIFIPYFFYALFKCLHSKYSNNFITNNRNKDLLQIFFTFKNLINLAPIDYVSGHTSRLRNTRRGQLFTLR